MLGRKTDAKLSGTPSNKVLISGKCLNTQIIGSVLSMAMRTSFWKSSESRAFEDLAKQYDVIISRLVARKAMSRLADFFAC